MTPRTDRIVFCDHCGPCERRGCNEHEVVTGPAPTPRTDREAAAPLTGRDVHAAWRDGMLAQGREVAPERMRWETLSEQDRELDDGIAAALHAVTGPEEGLREAARAVCDSVRWKGGEPFYTPSSVAYYDALRALARALGDSR